MRAVIVLKPVWLQTCGASGAKGSCLSMIISENRNPLFGIMPDHKNPYKPPAWRWQRGRFESSKKPPAIARRGLFNINP
jgi:hypothetical protein